MIGIKSAISIIENEKECVQNDCDRDCSRCELVKEESEIVGAFDTAIRSLTAWEELLQKLEEIKDDDTMYIHIRPRDAIDIINQKLVEMEE